MNILKVKVFSFQLVPFLCLFLLFALAGCGDMGDNPAEISPDNGLSWNEDIKDLLDPHCFNCHGNVTQNGNLNLADFSSWINETSLSGNPYIVAGNPDESELVWRLEGTNSLPRMPLNSQSLNNSTISKIRNWIEEGAKE